MYLDTVAEMSSFLNSKHKVKVKFSLNNITISKAETLPLEIYMNSKDGW